MIPFPPEQIENHWFFRYKIYHIPFWAFYHLMWGAAEFSLMGVLDMLFNSQRYIMFLVYVLVHTFAVYFCLYFLLPKFLEKGKLLPFILLLSSCIVFTSGSVLAGFYLTSYFTGLPLSYFCGFESDSTIYDIFRFCTTGILPHTSGAVLLGLTIKLIKTRNLAKKRQQKLEKEKLETELKFLKSQFNPHFLFNTINSIFFLIHKDPGKASNALAKFSELLRYQLYECNEPLIPLNHEISYLKNFISLEKLRKSSDLRIQVDMDTQQLGHLGIAPFLLMTFVENAFKHVSEHSNAVNWITIKLYFSGEHTLNFMVSNSKASEVNSAHKAMQFGGIGLKNVKRRLDLIYPQKHEMNIKHGKDQFRVQLSLQLRPLANQRIHFAEPEMALGF